MRSYATVESRLRGRRQPRRLGLWVKLWVIPMISGPSGSPGGAASCVDSGRGAAIRTRDLLNPIQVRYQAALRPDGGILAEAVTPTARGREASIAGGRA